jgi:hypothetical protein
MMFTMITGLAVDSQVPSRVFGPKDQSTPGGELRHLLAHVLREVLYVVP